MCVLDYAGGMSIEGDNANLDEAEEIV